MNFKTELFLAIVMMIVLVLCFEYSSRLGGPP